VYVENPKTKGSGIICCIPHKGKCPNECEDCFFQSGRSYLEPLGENLPNMPDFEDTVGMVLRVNDGHDSSFDIDMVMEATAGYCWKFYNTSIPSHLHRFDAPVVLTVNPGPMTDEGFHQVIGESAYRNLMAVRVRTNTRNRRVVDLAVQWYTARKVPVILTFMAYFKTPILKTYAADYVFRKRTLNSYHAITTAAWRRVMKRYQDNNLVYSCGIEGEKGTPLCMHCGNCLRTYFAAMERRRTCTTK